MLFLFLVIEGDHIVISIQIPLFTTEVKKRLKKRLKIIKLKALNMTEKKNSENFQSFLISIFFFPRNNIITIIEEFYISWYFS